MFSFHGKIALVTLAFLTIAGVYLFAPASDLPQGPAIDVGLEHARPLTLSVSLTEGTARSLIDVDLDSEETAYLTVPAAWQRTEVRRTPLSSVASADADGQMKRWTFPADAGVSFSTDAAFRTLRIHNPSGVAVKIQQTRVNLAKNTSSYDVYLLTDGSLELP